MLPVRLTTAVDWDLIFCTHSATNAQVVLLPASAAVLAYLAVQFTLVNVYMALDIGTEET